MALTKAQIIAEVSTLLASAKPGGIVATDHRQTMNSLIDKVYDETIDGVSLTGTTLTFTRDGGAGTPIEVDLSTGLAPNSIISTGIISGGALTINSGDNSKLDIAAGVGYIADQSTNPITVTEVTWAAKTAVTLVNLATSFATDIAIDVNGDVVQQNSFTNAEKRGLIFLGGVDHSNQATITTTFSVQVPTNGIGGGR